jgi:hypothetical protein
VCCRRFSHWCERVELPLEVTTLDVAAPLTLALYGDAVVFTVKPAVETSYVPHQDAFVIHWGNSTTKQRHKRLAQALSSATASSSFDGSRSMNNCLISLAWSSDKPSFNNYRYFSKSSAWS